MRYQLVTAILFASLSVIGGQQKRDCRETFKEIVPLKLSQVYHKELGPEGAPALVLLHGLGGNSDSFINIVRVLKKKYRVILYDQRGHGRTEQMGWNYSLDVMAKDLGAILDELHIEKAHLLGLSFGARLGMQFSQRYPSRVLSLLIEDMEMIPRIVDYEKEYLEKARLSEHLPRFFSSKKELYSALRSFYSHDEAIDAIDYSTIELPDGRVEFLQRPHSMFLYDIGANGADLTEPLREIKSPLLFIRADPKNSFLSDEGVTHIQKNRPDVQIITVSGAEHNVHATHPKRVLEIAQPFFDSVR